MRYDKCYRFASSRSSFGGSGLFASRRLLNLRVTATTRATMAALYAVLAVTLALVVSAASAVFGQAFIGAGLEVPDAFAATESSATTITAEEIALVESQYEGMTDEERAEAIGRPSDDAINYAWDESTWQEPLIVLADNLSEGTASDMVSVALAESDGTPSGGNYNKYNGGNGEPWCAYFVVWCARQADVSADVIPAIYECNALVNYYQSQSRWHSPYSYTPKAGDLIFYSTYSGGSACHVGIVTSVSGGYVHTKEGNVTGDVVAVRKRVVGTSYVASNWYIKGYATPNYNTHSHSYTQRASAAYTVLEDDGQHSVTYVPKCACGQAAGITTKTEACTWVATSTGYECMYCSGPYNMQAVNGGHHRLFVDVAAEVAKKGAENVWYVSNGTLDYVVQNGLMCGINETSGCYFKPYDKVTRAQVVQILYNAAGDGAICDDVPFNDVSASNWFAEEVAWASSVGIVSGYEDGAFRPNNPITREELCMMLANFSGIGFDGGVELNEVAAKGILGIESVSSWARPSVYWAINEGIIRGDGNADGTSSLNPANPTTRAAAARMISALLQSDGFHIK